MLFSIQIFTLRDKVILRDKGILGERLNVCFSWTFEYRRKNRLNKSIKQIALIEYASDTYVFRQKSLKYSFINFLSFFSHFSACI